MAVSNSAFLKDHQKIDASDWVTLLGVSTLVWSSVIALICSFFCSTSQLEKFLDPTPQLQAFLLGAIILGWGSSWLASYLWNYAAKLLPISLIGQLTIFETLFALIFLTIIEKKIPETLELAGILIALIGISTNVYIMRDACKKSGAQ